MNYNTKLQKKSSPTLWAVVEVSPHEFQVWPVVDYMVDDGEPVAILMSPHGPERGDSVSIAGFTTRPPSRRETW